MSMAAAGQRDRKACDSGKTVDVRVIYGSKALVNMEMGKTAGYFITGASEHPVAMAGIESSQVIKVVPMGPWQHLFQLLFTIKVFITIIWLGQSFANCPIQIKIGFAIAGDRGFAKTPGFANP